MRASAIALASMLLLAACGATPAAQQRRSGPPPAAASIHETRRGDLLQFLPHNATQAWFLDIAGAPPGPLFDRALATICPAFCEIMARHKLRDLRAVVDGAMVIGADGERPYHIVIVVSPRVPFAADFLGAAARRVHRGVDIATWNHEGQAIDVALVHGHVLFGVAGGIEPFIQRALETDTPRSHFDEVLAEGVHDTHFWLLHAGASGAMNVAASLGTPVEVEVRMIFPDEESASVWFHKLDVIDDAMWSSLNLPETARTFQRYLRGRAAGVTFQPSVDEALHLTRDGLMDRSGAGTSP